MNRRRRAALVGLLATGTILSTALGTLTPARATAAGPTTADAGAVTITKTVTREHLVDAASKVVDSRTITVKLDRTKGLRGRDGISVSWSGAHPTAGLIGDINSQDAIREEYPFVLLQCRGVDSPSVPLAQRLRPETCFTQSPVERYASDLNTSFPSWRMDRYASAADRALVVNAPDPRPTTCGRLSAKAAERFVPFVTAKGEVFPLGSNGCAGTPPEMSTLATDGLPSNSTYAATGVDGRGRARFDVRSAEDNASLGCSSTVACSLVMVPVMGISCDLAGTGLPDSYHPVGSKVDPATKACMANGHFVPGAYSNSPGFQDLAVSGQLWWSESNWRGRINVPLSFAPSSDVCDLTGGNAPLYLYGSELAVQATTQWAPKFCLDPKSFPIKHVQTGEPQARNLLNNGGIDAALTTDLPDGGYVKPVVTAPIAVTGFAIAYAVDKSDRNPVDDLKLTPRLLAKLLTESYPVIPQVKNSYAALHGNPINMSADPEFIALNPGIQSPVPATEAASSLVSLSSDSDVMHALTSYLQADPEARAFLNGTPDPWGMVVNASYKGIELPVNNWPQLDTFVTAPFNNCLVANPVPYLPLVASPTSRLATVALEMQYTIAPSQVVCQQTDTGIGDKLVSQGRQAGGFRFLVGVTSLADSKRFGLQTASLLSSTATTAPTKFTDPTGRTFTAPDDASLAAAAHLLTPDPAAKHWNLDPAVLRKAPTAATTYPGTMIVSAAIPTSGLSATQAAHYATFLRFTAGVGQRPGSAIGTLAEGYLPMTAANGLGAQADYTNRAAAAVAAQNGIVPDLAARPAAGTTPPASPSTGTPGQTSSGGTTVVPGGGVVPGGSGTQGGTGQGGTGQGETAAQGVTGTVPPGLAPQLTVPGGQAPVTPRIALVPQARAVSLGTTIGKDLGSSALVMPFLMMLALVAGAFALLCVRSSPLIRRRRVTSEESV